jgi:uncharacterized repeat protein (TIGR03803 family)
MRDTSLRVWRAFVVLGVSLAFSVGLSAQTERILYSFTKGLDGGFPYGGLVSDGKGNYYGTTFQGGTTNAGVVFELSPTTSGSWTEKVIYNFAGYSNMADGLQPTSPLIFDAKGNIYGVTEGGGLISPSSGGSGTVFELSPNSDGTWTEKVLYTFTGGPDASSPYGEGIVFDAAGNIYGTSYVGGAHGYGAVYELVAGTNGTWTEKVIYSFRGLNDGMTPYGSTLLVDAKGNLYGVASGGGAYDYGVAYELIRSASGTWTQKILHAFTGGDDGASPTGNLLFDSTGNLYGTTTFTAYELVRGPNGTWTEKTLHRFAGGKDGATALAGLAFDKAGNLYGTTGNGGSHRGTVYELSPATGTWTERVLHRFASNGADGYGPQLATLVVDATGNIFGVTSVGGTSNAGVVFEIKP